MPIWCKSLLTPTGYWVLGLIVLQWTSTVWAGVSPSATPKTWAAKTQAKSSVSPKYQTSVRVHKSKLPDITVIEPIAPLTSAEQAISQRIEVGRMPCELGTVVVVKADPQALGYFELQLKNLKFHMAPVETRTGAIRLEDRKNGAIWLQLSNKSMLMNQKLGQRLADACMSPSQAAVAAMLEKTPAPNLLDALPIVVPAEATVTVRPIPVTSVAGVELVPLRSHMNEPLSNEPPVRSDGSDIVNMTPPKISLGNVQNSSEMLLKK